MVKEHARDKARDRVRVYVCVTEKEREGEGRFAVRGLRTREKAAKVAKDAFRVLG